MNNEDIKKIETTTEDLAHLFKGVGDLEGIEPVQISPWQHRECSKGHAWKIRRMMKSKDGGILGSMSWTEGELTCPECGGIPIKSWNEESIGDDPTEGNK